MCIRDRAEETLSGVVQQMEESLKVFVDEDIRYAFEENPRKANPWMLEEKKEIFLAVREEKLEAYYNIINLMIAQVFAGLIKRPEGSEPVLVIICPSVNFLHQMPSSLKQVIYQVLGSLPSSVVFTLWARILSTSSGSCLLYTSRCV